MALLHMSAPGCKLPELNPGLPNPRLMPKGGKEASGEPPKENAQAPTTRPGAGRNEMPGEVWAGFSLASHR